MSDLQPWIDQYNLDLVASGHECGPLCDPDNLTHVWLRYRLGDANGKPNGWFAPRWGGGAVVRVEPATEAPPLEEAEWSGYTVAEIARGERTYLGAELCWVRASGWAVEGAA